MQIQQKLFDSDDLQITEPAVYISAHDAAVRKRIKQCVSMPSSTPVEVPNTICAVTPTTITFLGLILQFTREAKGIQNLFLRGF